MEGWISVVGAKVDSVATEYVTGVVSTLCTDVAPFALVALTIWWMLLGWAVMRGEVQNSVTTVIWKAIKTSVIVLLALNSGAYNTTIADGYDGMRDSMSVVVGKSVADDTSLNGATVWNTLDALQTKGLDIVHKMDEEASWYNIGILVAEAVFLLGMTALILAALFIAMLSKIFGTFFIAVGPLFILCLLFKPTQRFFDGWLGMMINTIVLTWIGMFVAGFGVAVTQVFADQIFLDWDSLNALGTAAQFCLLCLMFAVIIMQAPSWAAALTGGSSMQLGGAMARDAAMLMMRRGGSRASGGGGGNSMQRLSVVQQLGNSAAKGVQRLGGAAAQGARQARYRLAALRGRGA
jgi:type IV secretion system protein VirB6